MQKIEKEWLLNQFQNSIRLVESTMEFPLTKDDGVILGTTNHKVPKWVDLGKDRAKIRMYFGNTTIKATCAYGSGTNKEKVYDCEIDYNYQYKV